MTAWQEKGLSRTGSSIWRQTKLPHWGKQSITECKWSSLCQQTSTFSLSWINISGSHSPGRPACSLTDPCVWRHIPCFLLLHPGVSSSSSAVETWREKKAGLLSKSLLDGKHKVINLRPAGWQAGKGQGRGVCTDCLERRFPRVSGRCQEEMGSSNWLYHLSDPQAG